MASNYNLRNKQPTDENGSPSKKTKTNTTDIDEDKKEENQKQFADISLELEYSGFKALPVFEESQKLEGLSAFLIEHGIQITKLYYNNTLAIESSYEQYRQLILKHCPNISQVKFEFSEYPDEADDANSQLLVKFLTALAPGLTSLETINNLIGFHYLSCMGYVYESFSNKIKFVKSDQLKPEELSVLSGDNNNDNPALSLEELIYCDNDFLYSRKRNAQSAESLALKPASLVDLVKLKSLRRIDLPFLVTKEKISTVTPLPLLEYASIRVLTSKRGKPSSSPFIDNIGRAVANVTELKLCGWDTALLVLKSMLMNCIKLEKLDLTELSVGDDYHVGIANLAGIKLKFKQLDAEIFFSHSDSRHLILHLINNGFGLTKINIIRVPNGEIMDRLVAASISLAQVVQHELQLNLTCSFSEQQKTNPSIESQTNKPDNLKITINFSN